MGTDCGRRKEVGEQVRCSCFGRTRSWAELGTFTTDLSPDFDLADGTLTQTVLYCRDDSECRGTAQTLRLIPSAPVAIVHARATLTRSRKTSRFSGPWCSVCSHLRPGQRAVCPGGDADHHRGRLAPHG